VNEIAESVSNKVRNPVSHKNSVIKIYHQVFLGQSPKFNSMDNIALHKWVIKVKRLEKKGFIFYHRA